MNKSGDEVIFMFFGVSFELLIREWILFWLRENLNQVFTPFFIEFAATAIQYSLELIYRDVIYEILLPSFLGTHKNAIALPIDKLS